MGETRAGRAGYVPRHVTPTQKCAAARRPGLVLRRGFHAPIPCLNSNLELVNEMAPRTKPVSISWWFLRLACGACLSLLGCSSSTTSDGGSAGAAGAASGSAGAMSSAGATSSAGSVGSSGAPSGGSSESSGEAGASAGQAGATTGQAGASVGGAATGGASAGCSTDDTSCKGACVNLQLDPENCGACDMACNPGWRCTSGVCRPHL